MTREDADELKRLAYLYARAYERWARATDEDAASAEVDQAIRSLGAKLESLVSPRPDAKP